MRDTPRTDEQINGKPCTRFECLVGDSLRDALVPSQFARQLERELNKANDRIKSLIEERDRANRLADWKWNLRGEFESLLGTDKIEEGIEAVKELKRRIKRLEEAGVELRECASWVGHSCCQYADQILRSKAAIEAWDKEANS